MTIFSWFARAFFFLGLLAVLNRSLIAPPNSNFSELPLGPVLAVLFLVVSGLFLQQCDQIVINRKVNEFLVGPQVEKKIEELREKLRQKDLLPYDRKDIEKEIARLRKILSLRAL